MLPDLCDNLTVSNLLIRIPSRLPWRTSSGVTLPRGLPATDFDNRPTAQL